jgi:hypothetical protein
MMIRGQVLAFIAAAGVSLTAVEGRAASPVITAVDADQSDDATQGGEILALGQREKAAPELQEFRGGTDTIGGVGIGAVTSVVVIVLVVVMVLLILG